MDKNNIVENKLFIELNNSMKKCEEIKDALKKEEEETDKIRQEFIKKNHPLKGVKTITVTDGPLVGKILYVDSLAMSYNDKIIYWIAYCSVSKKDGTKGQRQRIWREEVHEDVYLGRINQFHEIHVGDEFKPTIGKLAGFTVYTVKKICDRNDDNSVKETWEVKKRIYSKDRERKKVITATREELISCMTMRRKITIF